MKNWITTTRWKAATFFVPPLWSLIKILDKRERSYIFFLSIRTHLSPLYIVHESQILCPGTKTSSSRRVALSTCTRSSQRNFLPLKVRYFQFLPLFSPRFSLSSPFFPSLFVCLKGWHGFCEKVEKNEQNREKVRIWFSLLTTDGVVDENRFNKRI